MPTDLSFSGIMAAIARGAINDAIANLREYSDHLTEQDKIDLLTLLQLQNHV